MQSIISTKVDYVIRCYMGIICYGFIIFVRVFNSEIPINTFGKGLKIWHAERIIVNSDARVGEWCSLSSGVVIAQAHDNVQLLVTMWSL